MKSIVFADGVVDLERGIVTSARGSDRLTDKEALVLEALARQPGVVVTREELWSSVWGAHHAGSHRLIDNVIRRLRRKLERDPADPVHILTVLGSGYRFEPPKAAPPVDLPRTRGPVFGRGADRSMIADALETTRLVTLVGPAGVGKTTLARWFAADEPGAYAAIRWVDLSTAFDAESVRRCVLESLTRLGGGPTKSSEDDAICDALAPGTLVVLDTFEQAADAAQRTVGVWLDRSTDTHFLVTSRQRLHLPGERVHAVEPLPCDAAVALLAARAEALGAPAIAPEVLSRVADRFERMPLALELASSLLPTLGPEALIRSEPGLLQILDHEGGTMTRALEWSWQLLDESERATLCAASVFTGGWSLDALNGVQDGSFWRELARLVEQSLVQVVSEGSERRFRLGAIVQAFVEPRRHSAGLDEPLRARHAEWYFAWATPLIRAVPDDIAASRELESDVPNVIAALDVLDDARASELGMALDAFLEIRGMTSSRLAVLGTVLLRAADPSVRCEALLRRARILQTSDPSRAESDLQSALDLARDAGLPDVAARTQGALGEVWMLRGRIEEAWAIVEAADAAARRIGLLDPHLLLVVGGVRAMQRDLDRARDAMGRARALFARRGHRLRAANVTRTWGHLEASSGDVERARVLLLDCLEGAEALENKREQLYAHLALSTLLALRTEERNGSRVHLEEARARLGTDPAERAYFATAEACCAIAEDDARTASTLLESAERAFRAVGNDLMGTRNGITRAALMLAGGEEERARLLLHDLAGRASFAHDRAAEGMAKALLGGLEAGSGRAREGRRLLDEALVLEVLPAVHAIAEAMFALSSGDTATARDHLVRARSWPQATAHPTSHVLLRWAEGKLGIGPSGPA